MHRRDNLPPTLTFLLISLTLTASIFAQQTSTIAVGEFSPAAYVPGEKLTYNVSFSNFSTAAHVELFNAGRGQVATREGIELRAHVQTLDEVHAALYAINNDYTAYVDPQTGLPFLTRFKNLEAAGMPPSPTAAAPPSTAADATPSTYDFLSGIFRLRALPLAAGGIYRISVEGDGAQYDVEVRVTGREAVKTPAGTFNAIATQLRVRNNQTVDNYRTRIYFSDDARHVPVMLAARLASGEVRAQLASSELLNTTPATPPTVASPNPVAADPPRRTDAPPAAGDGDDDSASIANLPFKVGEQLNFSFFLGNSPQPVGVATYHVRARNKYFGRDGFWLSATMTTSGNVQQLFPVNDKIETYVDTKRLLPFRSELQIREGGHQLQGVVSFDQERSTAIATDGKPIDIPVGTYDLVSVIYALRSFDLSPTRRNAVSLLINKRPRTLFITSLKRETILLGGKSIPAYQLALATDEPQGDRFNLRLWVGADRRRLPLRLTATTPLGAVRADLSIIPLAAQ
ncbi:MAG TPA: DUF3108 domain-containing protein [Pyrinomonadaceae bacterium]|nr:DUF3108 domain-containing protein [Pyrinomonadaceae bacterium]